MHRGLFLFWTAILQPHLIFSQYSWVIWFLEHPVYTGLMAAVLFEIITIVCRFGFGLSAPTHTRVMARFTGGLRVHHGYPGIGMLIAVPIIPSPTIVGSLVLICALMLFVSDLIHHSVVLPLSVGSHEFDLKYPSAPSDAGCDSGTLPSRIMQTMEEH
jgi:hypothetical protein